MLFTTVLMGCLQYYYIIPSFKYVFMTLQDNQILYDKLSEFIEDIKYDDIITDDLLITAWDYNSRTPYLFTKKNIKTD